MAGIDLSNIVKSCTWGLIAILSFTLNVLCLVVLRKAKDIDKTSKIFLKSLTMADLMILFFRIIPAIGASALNRWPYGDPLCLTNAMLAIVGMYAMYLSLLAVNIDRCFAIMYPLRYPILVNVKRTRIAAVSIWVFCTGLVVACSAVGNWDTVYLEDLHLCSFNATFLHGDGVLSASVLLIVTFYLPIVIIIAICCCFVLVMMIVYRSKRRSRGSGMTINRNQSLQRNTKAATTFFLMAMSQIVVNVPWIIGALRESESSYAGFVSEILFSLSICWDVVVYYIRNRSFRKTMNGLFVSNHGESRQHSFTLRTVGGGQ